MRQDFEKFEFLGRDLGDVLSRYVVSKEMFGDVCRKEVGRICLCWRVVLK